MFMKYLSALSLVSVQLLSPALAAQVPTPADEAAIDAIILPTLANMKAQKPKEAIDGFFRNNPMASQKAAEFDYVALQAEATLRTYGPISDCQLVETRNRGSWAQTRLYICRQEKFLTRWLFTVMNTTQGWKAANFRFDDKYMQTIDE
jgi:hypothetical protein